MNIPAHKQTDPAKKPGQIVNREPKITIPKVLEEEINRMQKAENSNNKKKLTFDDWFCNRFSNPDDLCYSWCKEAWETAQENM
jgi:hypothetical protein